MVNDGQQSRNGEKPDKVTVFQNGGFVVSWSMCHIKIISNLIEIGVIHRRVSPIFLYSKTAYNVAIL